MDVKNTWVSEIRKVLTGQLEACKGVFFTSGVRGHSPSHRNTIPFKPDTSYSTQAGGGDYRGGCCRTWCRVESLLLFINVFVRINL